MKIEIGKNFFNVIFGRLYESDRCPKSL